jgi:hypothetical protein
MQNSRQRKRCEALENMHNFEDIKLKPPEMANTLFKANTILIIMYIIQLDWDHMSVTDVEMLKQMKATNLRELHCKSEHTPL